MEVRVIVDAGPLVGWFNAADQWHHWSVTALSARRGPLHTTEIVLGEAAHHLGGNTPATQALLSLVRGGALVLHALWPARLERSQELMLKYPQMDPADASLVTLSEVYPRAALITLDVRHFRLYRRFRRETLPLLAPD